MTKNIKLFFIAILLSLPFWWGVNILQRNLEDFFYTKQMENNAPHVFLAQISNTSEETENIEIAQEIPFFEAESVISVLVTEKGEERILFKKAEDKKLPVASITKLLTAIVANEFYYPSLRVQITQDAIRQEGEFGNLKIGEILKVDDLIKIMLIESSNDAAYTLAEAIGSEGFTNLMNLKAKDIGLENSYFFNQTGLDSNLPPQKINYSTAQDLVKLARYLLKNNLFLDILSKKEYTLYLDNGVLHHTLKNTNEILGEIPEIIGGKTGWTETAGGCLFIILEAKKPKNYIINVILNSPQRFEEMRKLIDFSLENSTRI